MTSRALHVLSEYELESELLGGDDFVQWSLRFRAIVFDDGTVRRAPGLLFDRQPWPNVDRKRAHATRSLDLAHRFIATGDEEGALEQVRTALSLAARARLLAEGMFPLSRAELPAQLEAIGCPDAAQALAATIMRRRRCTNLRTPSTLEMSSFLGAPKRTKPVGLLGQARRRWSPRISAAWFKSRLVRAIKTCRTDACGA